MCYIRSIRLALLATLGLFRHLPRHVAVGRDLPSGFTAIMVSASLRDSGFAGAS